MTLANSRTANLPLALGLALAACLANDGYAAAPPPVAPAAWHTPLPHDGQLSRLSVWWQQFDDPLLAQFVHVSQQASPTLASARARIEQARANRVASGANLLPAVDATAGLSRGRDVGMPLATTRSGALELSWELDLFGGVQAGARAAQARESAARAEWHDARVLVAAEVASSYVSLRACESRLVLARVDASSRHTTAALNAASAQSGLQSIGNAALARASAAQGSAEVLEQQARCDLAVKGLVALTALDESALREQLRAGTARIPQPAQFSIAALPAQVLAQRPDLAQAQAAVQAAQADLAQSEAARYPRIGLAGTIGRARSDHGAAEWSGTTWSFGPLSITLPVFDGGRRRAATEAAQARHDEALALYSARVRKAVRETEEALLALQSTQDREQDVQTAADGFATALRATQARWQAGLASLFELEDARRNDVQAQMALIALRRERVLAWISLYRAVGGGWEQSTDDIAFIHDSKELP